jgi:hypothetical protein
MSDQAAAVVVSERVRPWRDAEADADAALLAEVRVAYPDVAYEDCSEARLVEITRRHGIDFATAFFYDRVRRAPATRAFLDRLDALGPAQADAHHARLRGRVLIAPGAFYLEHPRFGSDGRIVREAAAPFGLNVELIRVPSLGTVRENAAVIRQRLEALADDAEAVVLVSLSKGGADARLAIEQMGTPPRALRAWINVCGLVNGTPVVDRILSHWWWRAATNAYVALRGGSRGVLPAIASSSTRAVAPRGVFVINVVAFPMRRHLFGISHVHHRYMAARGPSDGLALLRDEIIEPGVTLPVWGSDHYFRLPGVPDVLNRLFRYLADGGWLHAHDA